MPGIKSHASPVIVYQGNAIRDVLLHPSVKARRIESIKGSVAFMMQEDGTMLRIDNVSNAHNMQAKAGGMDVEISYAPTQMGCSMDLAIRPGTMNLDDFKVLARELANALPSVADAKGHPLYFGGRAGGHITDAGVHVVIAFKRSLFPPDPLAQRSQRPDPNAIGPATTFVWEIPTSVSRYREAFEIKNVPIPAK